MGPTLLTHEAELVAGTVVDRPNRFVVRVRVDGVLERAYLGDPGALEGVVEPGATVLCSRVDDPERATDLDAVAARAGDVLVSLRAALANDLFAAAVAGDHLPAFDGWTVAAREPPLPDHGRTDFVLGRPAGGRAHVEVKSATHVDAGVARFPDRQTERGRRHLRSLTSLVEDGGAAHVVFVVQRPDVERLEPFRAVDPDFADRLASAREAGVGVHAVATAFDPPAFRLASPSVPVELS